MNRHKKNELLKHCVLTGLMLEGCEPYKKSRRPPEISSPQVIG